MWEHLSFQPKGCADRIDYHRVGAPVSSEESFAPSMPGPPQHRKNAGNPTPARQQRTSQACTILDERASLMRRHDVPRQEFTMIVFSDAGVVIDNVYDGVLFVLPFQSVSRIGKEN